MPPRFLRVIRYFVAFERMAIDLPLRFSPNFIFDLFEIEFVRTPSNGIGMLVVTFVNQPEVHLHAQASLGALDVNVYLDVNTLRAMDVSSQKRWFLDSIMICLENFAGQFGWDIEHCRATHARIVHGGIVFDRSWGKRARWKRTGVSAQMHISFYDDIELSVDLLDRDGAVRRRQWIARLPGAIGAVTGMTIAWADDVRVQVWMDNKRDFWEYNTESDEVVFHYPRAERGDAHGEYDFAKMYLDGYLVSRDVERALYWLRRSAAQKFGRAVHLLAKLEAEQNASVESTGPPNIRP